MPVEIIKYYKKLLSDVDAFTDKILNRYKSKIKCKAGCSYCCKLDSLFPVEVYSILLYLKDNLHLLDELSYKKSEYCIFLKNDRCLIYNARPIICRTHGYPILVNDTFDICPLNKAIEFEPNFCINLENLNTILSAINIWFINQTNFEFLKTERINLESFFFKRSKSNILSILHILK